MWDVLDIKRAERSWCSSTVASLDSLRLGMSVVDHDHFARIDCPGPDAADASMQVGDPSAMGI